MPSTSEALFQRAANILPGGVNSPVRACKSVGCEPVFIERAAGSRMWTVDGLELIERCYRFHPSLETIIISGYGDFAYAKAALRFGVRDYILKPVDAADLAAALSRVWLRLSEADLIQTTSWTAQAR